MTNWLLITLLSVGLVAAGEPAQNDVSAELKKLRGIWLLVAEIDDGKQMPVQNAVKNKLTFDGDGRWKVEIDGRVVGEGTSTIDPNKRPKQIDYTFTMGEAVGQKFVAIYELDGDLFRHCGVLRGRRPSEFSSTPGSGQILTTFKREKPE